MKKSQDSWISEEKTVSKRIEDSEVKQKYDFYQTPEKEKTIPVDEKRSVQASIVGSIRSLESRNLEERNHEMAQTKVPNLINDLSDMLGDSSLNM